MKFGLLYNLKSVVILYVMVARHLSSQYADNIRFVDSGLEKLVAEIDAFFNDTRTLFVFSSDHGMTDWGKCYPRP